MADKRGAKGARGRTGARGRRGPTGPAGPAGPKMAPSEVLALVEDQFYEIRKQLNMNIERMAQLQAQLDEVHRLLKQLVKGPY